MKFPYGISDFYQIITEDYLYIDRTDRIPFIENSGKQLLFLRPRRFGKSLWLSTLANYYDAARADDFDRLFGHLAIGQNPTPLRNKYLIMRWNFSVVDPQGNTEAITAALHDHINVRLQTFIDDYRELLGTTSQIYINNAISSFNSVLAAVRRSPYRVYLLIDEYDNFANEVLTASKERYEALVHGEGVIKTIFKAVKDGASGLGIDRVFITGVSPIVMSDITSGYNVAKNIYFTPELNDLCGFSEAETNDIVEQVAAHCGYKQQQANEAMTMMRRFYNGYRFSYNADQAVYNPTLALYFLKHWHNYCQYPRDMLDSNLAMDRNKITYIARLPRGDQVIAAALDEDNPLLVNRLSHRFGVADMLQKEKETVSMASLLYFFGVLTIGGETPLRQLILRIPNLVTQKLYVEQLQRAFLPSIPLRESVQPIVEDFFLTGNLQPLCDFIESKLFRVLDNRDYRWADEFSLKMAFLTLLFNDFFYTIDSEPALKRSYADLLLLVRPDMRDTPLLDFLLEFKYVSLKEAGLSGDEARQLNEESLRELPAAQTKLHDAQKQLRAYHQTLQKIYSDKLKLRSFVIISIGFERLMWKEIIPEASGSGVVEWD